MGAATAIQTVVYTTLAGDSAVTSLVGSRVYDHVPQPDNTTGGSLYPFINIGEDDVNDWSTDTELGFDVVVRVHSWSRGRGRKGIKELQSAIYDALNRANLTVSGYSFVTCDFVGEESFVDADGLTYHGVSQFHILIDQS